jgi:SNF2 family DNA or RNA helicase
MCRGTLQENKFKEIKQTMEEETIDGFVIKTDTLGRRVKIDAALASLYQKMTRSKLEELKRIISFRGKTVVYSQYNTVLESFSREIPSSIITGRSSRAQRKRNIESFKQGDTNVFFLSTKIADVGINLTEGDTLVFLEPGIDSDVQKQAIGRLTRIGQDKVIHIYKLYSKKTLEDVISLERPKYEQAISKVMSSGGSKSYISKKKKQYYLGYITNILKFN